VLPTICRLLVRSKCFRPERERPGGSLTHGTCAPLQGTHNVFVERLWRSVKYEEVYLRAYESVSAARAGIARYMEFFNTRRPHSALDGCTPDTVYFDSLPLAAAA
jgi:integrase-like protein